MEKENGRSNMKVMVVIDESSNSYHTLMWVINNLKESINNSPLVIFAAQPPPNCNYVVSSALGFARMYTPFPATMDLINYAQQQNKKVALGLLEKAKRICTSEGVKAETITEAGDPYEPISGAVQKNKINLLVIGNTSINGTLRRDFLGNESSYFLINAKCPVLVVKKPE